jgi:large exoprotein involved in heme utilization and adhesion
MTEGNAGNITLIATDSVQLNGVINKNVDGDYFSGSYVYSDTYTNGNGGNVIIKAKDLELIGSHISTWSSATIAKENNANSAMTEGNAGNITLIATDSVHLNGVINKNVDGDYFSKSYVYSDTNTNGNGGNVIIKAKDLELTGSYISTGSEQVASNNGEEGSLVSSIVHGNAGNVDVDITDSIRMLTTKELIGGYPYYSSIFSGTKTNGNAGNVTINAKNIELQGSYINAITSIFQNQDSDFNVINSILTQGDGGNVTVNASNTLKLDSYMYKNPDGSTDWYMFSYIGSDTLSNGDGGGTMVNARNLEIRGGGIGVSSSINYNFSDKEGNFGVPFFIKGTTGDVTVNVTDSIKIMGDVLKKADGSEENRVSSISSDTSTNGSAGNVIVNARTIDLQRGGVISSSARNFESYDKDWNITQTTLATGKAGNVTVKADELVLNGENTEISTSTYTKGLAGEVDINVNNVNVLNGASISSGSFGIDSSGQSGNIKINAQDLDIKSSGTITIKNEAVVENNPQSIPVGTIDIHAKNINIDDALITSESTGNVNAGNIRINYDNLFKLTNKAFINATSVDGNGGYLSISSPSGVLSLQDSRMATTATGAISNGGNIDINSDIMILNTGSLLASTVGGKGGNITLNLQSLVPSSNNLLEVGSKQFDWKPFSGVNVLGASGSVKSNVPQLNLSGVLANITNATMDNSLISQDYCALGQGSSLSKKGRGALPFRPRDLQVY